MDKTKDNTTGRGYGLDDNYVSSGDLVEKLLSTATRERDRQRAQKRENEIYIYKYKEQLKQKGVM